MAQDGKIVPTLVGQGGPGRRGDGGDDGDQWTRPDAPAGDWLGPRWRPSLPWIMAAGINILFFLAFGLVARAMLQPGSPTPDNTIPVVVIAAADLLPETEETQDDFSPSSLVETPAAETPTEEAPTVEVPEEDTAPAEQETVSVQPEPEPEPESEPEPEPETAPRPAPRPSSSPSARQPEIDLPQADGGGPSGLVALRCYELFKDPDKAAECAGRPDIRSGWTADGSDWSGIYDALREGGVDVAEGEPLYGPQAGDLPPGAEAYQPFDEGLIIGRKLADRLYNERRFNEMKDPRSTISEMQSPVDNQFSNLGDGGSVPLFIERWEPSWVLKDQPGLDRKVIDEMIREAEQGAE